MLIEWWLRFKTWLALYWHGEKYFTTTPFFVTTEEALADHRFPVYGH